MTLNQHIAVTVVAAAALVPLWPAEDLILFCVGSVLIDVDHYFCYIQRTVCFSVRGMFRYYEELWKIEQNIPYFGLCLFHTVDFFFLISILTYFYPFCSPLLAGLLFHFVVDLFDLFRKKIPFIRAYFVVEHLIRRRQQGYPHF